MRKKFTMLFVALLACVGVAKAQPAIETSTADAPMYYVIASYNRGGVLTNAGVGNGLTHVDLSDAGYWYFEKANEDGGVHIVNKTQSEGKNVYVGSDLKASITAAVWYIVPNGVNNADLSISSTATISGNSCIDASNRNTGVGSWRPSASDWNGTTWVVSEEKDLVDVMYNYEYNGTSKGSETATVTTAIGYEFPAIATSFPFGVSATKPAGNITEADVVDGVVTKTVAVEENLPFVYAANYASVENWYYLKFHADQLDYLYYDGTENVLDATKTAVDENNKDAYTWAFVGNPFDGFKVVNMLAGADKRLNAAEAGAVVGTADQTFKLTASTHGTNGFFMQATTGSYTERFNKQSGKVVYWSDADAGSTFMVELRPMGPVAELAALVEEIENANIVIGTNPGEYTEASANKLNEALETAKTVGSSATESDLNALQAAYDAFNPIIAGSMYRIVSAHPSFTEQKGITCYAQDGLYRNRTNPGWAAVNENDPLQYWVLEDAGNGAFNLKAAYEGNFITTATSMTEAAKAATFTLLDKAQFNITLAGEDNPLHCNGWNWSNTTQAALTNYAGGVDSPSAWKLIAVTETPEFTYDLAIGEVGYATLMLAYNATIPTGATCYTAAVDGEYVKLTEVEGNVLPAKTPVIVAAAAETYTFTSTDATATVSAENELVGSLYPQIITPDANTTCYVLAKPAAEEGEEENPVGFYKAALNQSSNAAFLNNANKVYLPVAAGAEAPAMFSFGRGEGTTGIDKAQLTMDNVVIYDLLGRRVEKMEKGIYIVNGKKIIK